MAINRISGNNRPMEVPPSRSSRADGARSKTVGREQDRVSLSARKSEFSHFRTLVDAAPDVRSGRVEELARIIDRGEYHVDSLDVADALIQQSWNELKS
jgi:flagellar biosynthesis anti-sigma factor FlgM